jgi:hypothetical protein
VKLTTQFLLVSGLRMSGVVPLIPLHFYSKTKELHQFLKFILFCSSILHVSDGLSVHHQESNTVHTASDVCQIGNGNEKELQFHLVPASKQSAESVWHIPDAVCTVLDSWWWTERSSETCRVILASSQQNLFDIYLMLCVQS